MNNKKFKRLKGSGILVVILSSIAFSIYTMSTFSQSEHFGILVNKYIRGNKEYYEKYIDDVNEYYQNILIKNNINNKGV